MTDYAEHLINLRHQLNELEKSILHDKMEKLPEIFREMDKSRDLLEFWYWKERNKLDAKAKK